MISHLRDIIGIHVLYTGMWIVSGDVHKNDGEYNVIIMC